MYVCVGKSLLYELNREDQGLGYYHCIFFFQPRVKGGGMGF